MTLDEATHWADAVRQHYARLRADRPAVFTSNSAPAAYGGTGTALVIVGPGPAALAVFKHPGAPAGTPYMVAGGPEGPEFLLTPHGAIGRAMQLYALRSILARPDETSAVTASTAPDLTWPESPP